MKMSSELPEELKALRAKVLAKLSPLKPADEQSKAPKNFLFVAKRTDAGRKLPPYYLVYFLLVDFLGFRDVGRFEKVAWSIPVDLGGVAFLIEHRKFGCGVFAADLPAQEEQAAEIVRLIHKAAKLAKPYFEWRAATAAASSKLNVHNHGHQLFERFEYMLAEYRAKTKEAAEKSGQSVTRELSNGGTVTTFPFMKLDREARWLALAAIESFFSWTEHIFIHLAILSGRATTGAQVSELAKADWADKFKAAIPLGDPETKTFYDKLVSIRRQLRNAVAHGSFGKQGEAFRFHSNAGAVPLLLPHQAAKETYSFGSGIEYLDDEAIDVLESFIEHLWSGPLGPARLYIQESALPLILTMAANGEYAKAMQSEEDMTALLERLNYTFDQSANMDW